MLRDLLTTLIRGYDAYHSGVRVDVANPMHVLLHRALPETLRSLTPNHEAFKFDGSDGLGNVTAVPWVAAFHREITTSATSGYYLVWLLPEDRRNVVLELGLGATQFAKLYGENKRGLEATTRARAKVLGIAAPLAGDLFSQDLRARVSYGELPPLGKTYEHKAYGRAAILSVTYPASALPAGAQLESDYREFVRLYERLVASPLMPTTEELVVDEVIEAAQAEQTKVQIQEVVEFRPRDKQKRASGELREARAGATPRYSRASKKVGDLGERLVFEYLQRTLREYGKPDLAEKVTWHQESSSNRTPGWDITSYDPDTGHPIFVEVKATQGETISEVILTRNEWEAAIVHGAKYFIYLVTNALRQNPSVEIVRDPVRRVTDGELSVREASWALRL